ncbi:phytoene desaturase family protein [Thermasporomyces composti]|uniref:Phytoene dehydrogenase-like protein n=1 Tax=Thermasporomyces composti TaxID=696763 RepID=A0A3D9V873_THECX|nr:NAD(P)/FAD-dependent oxidoreductase [Thermasporomyces composti]REF37669.1 phytoene dehydrogenase-like protein [Thermasporomyces composti]
MERYDAVVVGGGHNGLVAAAYLAKAGLSVLVLERLDHIGGAAVSERVFPGLDARLSRYSYLVSLLPDQIVADLGLKVRLASRAVASYTPVIRHGAHTGLLVERDPGPATEASFRALTGGDTEYAAWRRFYGELGAMARTLAPTMLEPLRPAHEMRALVGAETWERFVATPVGVAIEEAFRDDTVRGVVLTDALIGTFTHAHDPSLRQNRCFLYHVIGNGTGEWRVPVGGMGAVTDELARAARSAGATLRTGAKVIRIDTDGRSAEVRYVANEQDEAVSAAYVLAGVAPATLDRLLGRTPEHVPEGCQIKINLLLTRLPRFRSGVDPAQAFAGTLHIDEGYTALRQAYDEAAAGQLPSRMPSELYCHTLTDPSILAPELVEQGWHTVTLFGLQTPARLFDDPDQRDKAAQACLSALNAYLEEPIEDCLARDADGRPCLEVRSPLDIESSIGMPGGHIFHGDLAWPWAEAEDEVGTWGVETAVPNLLICGSGARRGGGVSGIGGHNAAKAVLDFVAGRGTASIPEAERR